MRYDQDGGYIPPPPRDPNAPPPPQEPTSLVVKLTILGVIIAIIASVIIAIA